jgi:hypothetical protein
MVIVFVVMPAVTPTPFGVRVISYVPGTSGVIVTACVAETAIPAVAEIVATWPVTPWPVPVAFAAALMSPIVIFAAVKAEVLAFLVKLAVTVTASLAAPAVKPTVMLPEVAVPELVVIVALATVNVPVSAVIAALAGAIAANGAKTKAAMTPSAMRLDVFIDIYFLSK